MNIFEKLLEARLRFHEQEIKKSGWNDFSKYAYFELGDFVLPIMKIFKELKILSIVSFDKETAVMTLIDIDKPEERIKFTSPMGGAQLKGTHEIQQIGAVETYQRRYLYVMAMDIVEHDALENTRAADDAFTRMNAATSLKELQDVFAQEYQATKDKKEKADIKAEYDKLKSGFQKPEKVEE